MKNKKKAEGKKEIGVLLLALAITLSLTIFSSAVHAQETQRCRGNEICDVSVQGGGLVYENCQACGSNLVLCPAEVSPVSVERTCENVGVAGARCVDGDYTCPEGKKTKEILRFSVYAPSGLDVTAEPAEIAALPGERKSIDIVVKNDNPIRLGVLSGVEAPEGWEVSFSDSFSINANAQRKFTLRITSADTVSDDNYPVKITLTGTPTGGSRDTVYKGEATVMYQVASRAAPSVTIEPTSQTGIPGQELVYTITATNNDPLDFDDSTIRLTVTAPEGWSATIKDRSERVDPQENFSTTLEISSPEGAGERSHEFTVNATAHGLSTQAKASYTVSFCGDGVCGLSESCQQDCVLETVFACTHSGRCEQETDTGLSFDTLVSKPITRFIICDWNAEPEECAAAYDRNQCGINSACICGNTLDSSCSVRCVDGTGAYYLYANELGSGNILRSNANYGFACPFVNLDEIKQLRNDFVQSQTDFEKARSSLKESINIATSEQREDLQPCFDGLGRMISLTEDHVQFLNGVIEFPAVSNTTEARRRTSEVRNELSSLFDLYCSGAAGILKIDSLTPPSTTEKGTSAVGTVIVKNMGTVNYYGVLECTFTPPSKDQTVFASGCTAFGAGQENTFSPSVTAGAEGEWNMQCNVLGSINSDCSQNTTHDRSQDIKFSVFSRDTYIVDVAGSCNANDVTCTVRSNREFACTGCRIENRECSRISQEGTTSTFSCPKPIAGTYDMTGYVFPTPQCNPVEPQAKEIFVSCAGCGDGRIDADLGEECELPNTDNNELCAQEDVTIQGGRRGFRDDRGYCTQFCQCSPDPFVYECVAGIAGAECSDGETREVTKTIQGKDYTCTEQCGPVCTFESCTVEPDPPDLILNAAHLPLLPTENEEVTITAFGNPELITIFVDNQRAAECTGSPCSYSSFYAAGTHTYFATGQRGGDFAAAPEQGIASFVVAAISGGPEEPANKTGENATSGDITLFADYSPRSPTVNDTVTFAASASRAVERLEIYIDNFVKKSCTSVAQCTYQENLTAGEHEFFAKTTDRGSAVSTSVQKVHVISETGASLIRVNFPETAILGESVELIFETSPVVKYGIITCSIKTPTKTSSLATRCFRLGSDESKGFIANEAGEWKIDSCTLETSSRATCFSAVQEDRRTGLGSINVTQLSDAFISDILTPDTVILDDKINVSVTLRNPAATRFAKVSCIMKTPEGTERQAESQCSGITKSGRVTHTLSFDADALGTWTLNSCRALSSPSFDCGGEKETQLVDLERKIDVVRSELLSIQAASLSSTNITIGEPVSVSVPVNNPTDSDRFGVVSCSFRSSIGSTLLNSSACSPVRSDSTGTFTVTERLPFIGTWNVTSCSVDGSLKSTCASSIRHDSIGSVGTVGVQSVVPEKKDDKEEKKKDGCEIVNPSAICSFSGSSGRYTVEVRASWDGGDHAHTIIEDDEGRKIYDSPFTAWKTVAAPGYKTYKIEVHDGDNRVLCSEPSKEIYCGPGNATDAKKVNIVRNMPSVVRLGQQDVELHIAPLENVKDFVLAEHVEQGVDVGNIRVSGNKSVINITNRTVAGTRVYTTHNFDTPLSDKTNFTITYTADFPQEGRYKFFYQTNMSGAVTQEDPFEVLVTDCPQVHSVLATGPGGACQKFDVPCMVPPGWKIVDYCPGEEPAERDDGEESGLEALLVVIVVLVIVVIGYRKRDALRAKLHRKKKEEFPSLENFRQSSEEFPTRRKDEWRRKRDEE